MSDYYPTVTLFDCSHSKFILSFLFLFTLLTLQEERLLGQGLIDVFGKCVSGKWLVLRSPNPTKRRIKPLMLARCERPGLAFAQRRQNTVWIRVILAGN